MENSESMMKIITYNTSRNVSLEDKLLANWSKKL